MMEYSFILLGVLLFLVGLDRTLGTRILRRDNYPFWKTAFVFAAFQWVFDNYFTFIGIWRFDSAQTMGVFIPFIPVENMVYGFELLALTVILYSFFARPRRD